MAIFYLETKHRQLTPESAVFKEAIQQHNWLYPANRMDAICTATAQDRDICVEAVSIAVTKGIENIIPIGSIKFVQNFCTQFFGIDGPRVEALNIPRELRCQLYMRRLVWDSQTAEDMKSLYKRYGELLVKPGKTPKLFEMTKYTGKETFPEGEPLFVSQPFSHKIVGEWRVFCLNGKIMSIHPYGRLDSWLMPDEDIVQEMAQCVNRYSCPSFAMDVAVLDNCPPDESRTAVIEVHPFISCGLYGFEGPDILKMAIVAWRHFVKEVGKNA